MIVHLRMFPRIAACILLAATLLIGGFGASPGRTLASGGNAPKINTYPKHGTIIFSDWEFPDTLNVFQTGLGVTLSVMNFVLASLDTFDQHAHLYPDLLVNIPTVKNHEILNGGKTIILKLKP